MCESRAVVVNVIAERVHQRERQVFLQRATRGLKKLFKDPGHRNQRRSGVEAKTALGPKIHLAAETVALLADHVTQQADSLISKMSNDAAEQRAKWTTAGKAIEEGVF